MDAPSDRPGTAAGLHSSQVRTNGAGAAVGGGLAGARQRCRSFAKYGH